MDMLFYLLILSLLVLAIGAAIFGQSWFVVIVYSGIIVVIGMPILLAVFKEWYKFWMLLGVYTLFAIWIALIKPYPYLLSVS